jgi:hypothetical protein
MAPAKPGVDAPKFPVELLSKAKQAKRTDALA